ncbi:MAG: PEP-CTERM sorting domain-containing protein [Verrucomicrobiota bacterium]|nr:PEP-CTERM sorting domain-containing protein [Verrucomicrobiota bacterium]
MKKLLNYCLIATGLLGSALPAQAVNIFSTNFDSIADGNPDGYLYKFTYSQLGGETSVAEIVSGIGVGGTKAARLSVDFTPAVGSTYSGAGFGHTDFTLQTPASSANLADYTFSFDYMTVGATGNSIKFLVKFENSNDTLDVELSSPAQASQASFTTYTGSLSTFTVKGGQSATNIPLSTGITLQAETANSWGFDSGNQIIIDNFSLSIVPEPSTYAAFAGLAILALAYIRRRK